MMRMRTLLAGILLTSAGCDPFNVIKVSTIVPAPVPESCVVGVLRSAEQVREVGKHDDIGMVYAELIIPDDLKSPHPERGVPPTFGVKEEINEDGERVFEFYMLWIGRKGSPEYRHWAEETMRELQNRVVDSCATPGGNFSSVSRSHGIQTSIYPSATRRR